MEDSNYRMNMLSAEGVREGKGQAEAPGSKEDCTHEVGMELEI